MEVNLMEKVLVLFSGGADSTLLLKLAEKMKTEVFALMIFYGQLHREELDIARKYCTLNKVPFKEVTISGYDVNSGLTGSGEQNLYEGVHSHNVPARNSIFLSLAYGFAESMGIQEIWYGANFDDFENRFPDCTQEYIGKFNEILKVAAVKPIKVYAPLLGMNKGMINNLLELYGIKKEEVFSGYGQFS
jgi:7-cyano-7-deazaguanine synthase